MSRYAPATVEGPGEGAAAGRRSVEAGDAVEEPVPGRRGDRGPVRSSVGGEGDRPR